MSTTEAPARPEDEEEIAPEEDIWQYMPWLREIRQQMYEETRGMSHAEEIAYRRRKAAEYDEQRAARSSSSEGDT